MSTTTLLGGGLIGETLAPAPDPDSPAYYTEAAVRIDRPTVGMVGLRRRLALLWGGAVHPLTGVTLRRITLIRPDGSRVVREGSEVRITTDSQGRPALEYTVEAGDWPEAGPYTEIPYVEDAAGRWPGEPYRYRVHPAPAE